MSDYTKNYFAHYANMEGKSVIGKTCFRLIDSRNRIYIFIYFHSV